MGKDVMPKRDLTWMNATEPEFGMQVGRVLMSVHSADVCGGPMGDNGRPWCCIHNPSPHHMRTWPMNWRADTGVTERLCPHGVGHPDPDHMAYVENINHPQADGMGVHGCDGCCRAPENAP